MNIVYVMFADMSSGQYVCFKNKIQMVFPIWQQEQQEQKTAWCLRLSSVPFNRKLDALRTEFKVSLS